MKLLSATLRNYRIHREVSVDFDPARTVIGGPNEAGKSTLIEGIHRGLFLKAKGTGLLHKSMTSLLHGGTPEVDVCFEAGGREYTVRKRFSGQSGTTQLIEGGGQTWQGDEAEEMLANVLCCEEATGRATASKINDQWAHLWVWQGMAGSDPVEHLASRQDDLLEQLQAVGGGVALQSALDGRVAARFSRDREQVFVRSGNARAGSTLDKALTERSEAEAHRDAAAQRLAQLEDAIAGFKDAEAILQRTATELKDLAAQRKDLKARATAVAQLQQRAAEQTRTRDAAAEALAGRETAEQHIATLRAQSASLADSLAPRQATLEALEVATVKLREQARQAEQELDEAQAGVREARFLADLASAHVRAFELRAREEEIAQRLARVRTLEATTKSQLHQLSELPEIDRKGLAKLQKLESRLAQATAALQAMAAEVEIVAADSPVQIDGENLDPGTRRTLTEATVIRVGEKVEIRIHPGGGDRLEEAREAVRSLQQTVHTALDGAGLDSLEQAAKIVAQREHLEAQLGKVRASLAELDAEAIERSATALENEVAAAQAEVARRQARHADFPAPKTLALATAGRDAQTEAVHAAEERERTARARHEALRKELAEREQQSATVRASIDGDRQKQTTVEARLNLLLETHGTDAARAEAIEATRAAARTAESALTATEGELAQLQPALLPADQERLERSLGETNRQRESAQTDRAVHQSALRSDGSEDPQAALAAAEARLQAAVEHHDAVRRKADAIALVDDLFQQEQRTLANRFSRPLADKISSYLQCLFGPEAQAVVRFENNAFEAIDLVRAGPGGAEPFALLSGGAREQVAAAVRLAIAELLAAEFGGTLPVVFDDAFAYSDPARVQTLQRMLDLGASRGLQLIVLTCNPSDYVALGARLRSLPAS